MKRQVPRFARLRGTMVALFGASALLAACEAAMPTAAEVARMDVGLAEKRMLLRPGDSAAVYVVDGNQVTRAEAHALTEDEVASIQGSLEWPNARLVITTKKNAQSAPAPEVLVRRRDGSMEEALTSVPLLFIDGIRQDQSALKKLDRSMIASIEVIKGRAAAATYGTAAEHGVIVVTTKK